MHGERLRGTDPERRIADGDIQHLQQHVHRDLGHGRHGNLQTSLRQAHYFFFFQAEDGIRDTSVTGSSDVCSSDLLPSEPLLKAARGPPSDLRRSLRCKPCKPADEYEWLRLRSIGVQKPEWTIDAEWARD